MGVLPTVFSMVALCLCWLPGVGWLGILAGFAACAIGVLSIVYWYEKPGYTGWGLAGMTLGGFSAGLGLAYQIKHSMGRLDVLYSHISATPALGIILGSIAVVTIGLWSARKKQLLVWVIVTYIAVAATILTAGSALVTADRALADSSESI